MADTTLNKKGLMKAVQKHIGRAADAVQEVERRKQLEQQCERYLQAQRQQSMQPYWNQITTTSGSTSAYQTTAGSFNQLYPSLGGAPGQYPTTITTTGYAQTLSPPISFTAEQMSLFMEKLTHLLSEGWECIRCRRIWNPRETGCEFCNFIDRLEGKDVDRDTDSGKCDGIM